MEELAKLLRDRGEYHQALEIEVIRWKLRTLGRAIRDGLDAKRNEAALHLLRRVSR